MNDTPGVTYTAIRGLMDCAPMFEQKKHRSRYGTKRQEKPNFIRRCLRKIGLEKKKRNVLLCSSGTTVGL